MALQIFPMLQCYPPATLSKAGFRSGPGSISQPRYTDVRFITKTFFSTRAVSKTSFFCVSCSVGIVPTTSDTIKHRIPQSSYLSPQVPVIVNLFTCLHFHYYISWHSNINNNTFFGFLLYQHYVQTFLP